MSLEIKDVRPNKKAKSNDVLFTKGRSKTLEHRLATLGKRNTRQKKFLIKINNDIETKSITRDKDSHYIMIKFSSPEGERTFLN